ncbi:pyridoxamine 5'-phosphate oxidase family protein [Halalkalibacter alkalisediminis]|uniref:Pyridoxamine 5'-phosphate oxidase family protein n=1 Tax=Halalkalibacter alkalisediminis TaxID=935616 RepID=A0ABV6NCC2_9BACI|nr:pyridoxamine 5'-phosphate oxidase family protein [Halalkalibacter alkalisediminis]
MRVFKDRSRAFDLEEFLRKPLFAHLATVEDDMPKDSPLWFHWEKGCIWMIADPSYDRFSRRVEKHSKCAIGIVDFVHLTGKVLHAGFRGSSTVEPFDQALAKRLLTRYVGSNEENWDPRFKQLNDQNQLVCFFPDTVVIRDQSFTPSNSFNK